MELLLFLSSASHGRLFPLFQHSRTGLSSLCSLRTNDLGLDNSKFLWKSAFNIFRTQARIWETQLAHTGAKNGRVCPWGILRAESQSKPIKILSKWFDDIVAKLYLILNISLSVGSHSSCQAKGHEAGAAGSDACSLHCQCQCSPDPDTYWSKRAGGAGAAALA